jgi:1,2-phenylacetyl-CoA epoxidase catalytic subunit
MSDPTLLDVGVLDDATRAALRRLILTLADSKRLMGIRYSDWLLGSPSIETGIAASSMAQDEWGHARLLYAMLKDLGEDPLVVEHERPAEAYASLDPLDAPFPDWAAVVAGMTVVDVALAVALDACARGCFEPATTRVPKMCAEEEFHRSLAFAWYRRLAASRSDEARGLLRAATEAMLPPTLAWLGADDEAARALVDAGVTRSGAELSASFREAVGEVLRAGGVDVDAIPPATSWDAARARGPGHPDEEAVERARGDRNRMLFVE